MLFVEDVLRHRLPTLQTDEMFGLSLSHTYTRLSVKETSSHMRGRAQDKPDGSRSSN